MSASSSLPKSDFSVACRRILVLGTVILWWLSLQRAGLFALGWVAFAPFFLALNSLPRTASRFWFGWRTGILAFAAINWWIIPAIVKGGGVIGVGPFAGFFLGILAVILIGIVHGTGLAVLAALWNLGGGFFRRIPLLVPLAAAAWWWVFEALRTSGPLAHAWGALACSQWRDTALLQSAAFVGQHGLSALCLWFSASFALWLQRDNAARSPSLWILPMAVFAALHAWGGWRLWNYDHETGTRRSLAVALVQTDVPSLRKNRDGGESHFDQARRLTREFWNAGGRADLVVWPETTATLGGANDDLHRLSVLVGDGKGALLTGAQASQRRQGLYNRALLVQLAASGDVTLQSSDKVRVVPFGERAPFSDQLPWLSVLAPKPPVIPASEASLLTLGGSGDGTAIGPLICFESCFPQPGRDLRARGAGAFFVLTNDEWCAGTTAPWEHAVMSVLRAAENGVSVAQAANGGFTFAVDARGRFLAISDFGKAQTLEVKMALR